MGKKRFRSVDLGVVRDDDLNTVCPSNEEGFKRILTLYARPGHLIVDPTYGNGRFWKNVNKADYRVLATDIVTDGVDLRALPYADDSVNMVVLDPPYRYTPLKNKKQEDSPNHGKVDGLYRLTQAKLTNTQAVLDLYEQGMLEACRLLIPGGFLVVKCQDTVQDGRNIWVHTILMEKGALLGFACRDLLIVNPPMTLKSRWDFQRHLRKSHSYFLVFRKGGHFPFGVPAVGKRSNSNGSGVQE
jgi:hypothetical protein